MSDFPKPRYSENSASLWTPFATGVFPLGNNLVFQLDADYTASFVTGANNYLSQAFDNVGDIEFGPRDPADVETYPIYGSSSHDAYIGNRRTIWFWEDSVRYGPNTTLTSSATTNWSTKNFPVDNEDRAVWYGIW